jgi:hypothetical protein
MEVNSPTETAPDASLTTEPTGQDQGQVTADVQTQDTSPQGSVSDDTATQKQTQETGGAQTTDDGLANFAKSQGIEDLSQLNEREQKLLKIAHDNVKAYREKSKTNNAKVTDVTEGLGDGSIESEVAQLKYERTTDKFWSQTGEDGSVKYDKSLEPVMVDLLKQKIEELTPTLGEAEAKKYAFNLSRDLGTLYVMAQNQNGAFKPQIDAEAIRREERESINKKLSAGAPNTHATQGGNTPAPKITSEWIRNEYDPRNPEHVKLVDEFYGKK